MLAVGLVVAAVWIAAPPRRAWDIATLVVWVAWGVFTGMLSGRRERPAWDAEVLENRVGREARLAGWLGVAFGIGAWIGWQRSEEQEWMLDLVFGAVGVACLWYWARIRRQRARLETIRFRMKPGTIEGEGIPEGPWKWRFECRTEETNGDEGPVVVWEKEWETAGREWGTEVPKEGPASGPGVVWELRARADGVEAVFEVPVRRG
jgi:hypothetical protein